MYAKIFAQIYDGTLCTVGPWEALVTFQQMLVLADKDGAVDMTAGAISRRTSIPLPIIEKGIASLILPDPESRTPDEEGKRLIPIADGRSWGWRVVNYAHYRKLQREEDRREYHSNRYKATKQKPAQHDSTGFNTSQQSPPIPPIAKAEAKAEAGKATEANASDDFALGKSHSPIPDCPHKQLVALYREILPTATQPKSWDGANAVALQARWRETFARLKFTSVEQGIEWFRNTFTAIGESDFLMGRKQSNGRNPFRLRLAWVVKKANFEKITENFYS